MNEGVIKPTSLDVWISDFESLHIFVLAILTVLFSFLLDSLTNSTRNESKLQTFFLSTVKWEIITGMPTTDQSFVQRTLIY